VLPNLLVPAIADAVEASRACKVYDSNVTTQRGETDGYTVRDHVAALESHVRRSLFPVVVANDYVGEEDRDNGFERSSVPQAQDGSGIEKVRLQIPSDADYQVITADLVDRAHPWRHDSHKLARALVRYLESQASS
jgi:uncharacterized cofD-like protein